MTWINRACVRHPGWTLFVHLIVVVLVAPGVLRLHLRTDGAALVPDNDARVVVDREIRAQFAIEDPVVILIETESESGIYDHSTLTLIRDLTEDLLQLDGVSSTNVVSLATEKVDRLHEGTLRFRGVLDPFPRDVVEIRRVRDDVREFVVMQSQWDGCCIGIPPTPYDSVEVTLLEPIDFGFGMRQSATVTGRMVVDPYVFGAGTLLGLYTIEDAKIEVTEW